MPECRTEEIRRIIRNHGPIEREQIFEYLGITKQMKGSRSAFGSALCSEVLKGFVLKVGNLYSINPDNSPRYQCIISTHYDVDILNYIKAHPGCTITEICDNTGISPDTTRRHIRRLPVDGILDVRTRRWYARE